MSGLFITFEGVEGAGKTTQIALLRQYIETHEKQVLVTREPGGPPIAESIRALLLDPANQAIHPRTELLLYAAARAQHVEERIRPALRAGKVVVCDRYADSTTAYQGFGRGLDAELIAVLNAIATGGLWPDLTIVLDMAPEEGLCRAARTGALDRIEQETLAFHQRVREGFLHLVETEPARVRRVDATRSIETVAQDIAAMTAPLLEAI